MSNKIQGVFGRSRVLLPVIHLPDDGKHADAAVAIAVEAGADGVVLINQGASSACILKYILPRLRERHPTLWIGANFLGWEPRMTLNEVTRLRMADPSIAAAMRVEGIWTDNAGVDALDAHRFEIERDEYLRAREVHAWEGLYFGGTAFKTQRDIPSKDLPTVAKRAASFMEVVCTSGRGTGVSADIEKVRIMREAIPGVPMALASGITPKNVEQYLPYVEAYLVATGIEKGFGVLDPVKTKALADTIHGYAG